MIKSDAFMLLYVSSFFTKICNKTAQWFSQIHYMNAIKKAYRQITCRPIDIISNYVLMLLSELFLDIPSNGTCAEHGC